MNNKKQNKMNNIRVSAKLRDNISGWALLVPFLFCVLIVSWQPIVNGVIKSFFATRGYETTDFVGIQNYVDVITDTMFLKTVGNTIMYVVWSLIIGFIPPILLALLLNEVIHINKFFRVATYLPYLAPSVATALIWTQLFQPGDSGILNMFLNAVGINSQEWLQNPTLAIPLIVLTMTWQGTPGSAVVYLAAMQGVSQEQYEAAIVDGASIWKRFFHITLPSISSTILLLTIRQIIGVFQIMQEPMIMTGGGPNNATMSLNLTAYNYAFTYMQVSWSLALGTISFLLLISFTFLYFKIEKRIKG